MKSSLLIIILVTINSISGYLLAVAEANFLARKQRNVNAVTAPVLYMENLTRQEKHTMNDKIINQNYIFLFAVLGPLPRVLISIIATLSPVVLYVAYFLFHLFVLIMKITYALCMNLPMPKCVERQDKITTKESWGNFWHMVTNKEKIVSSFETTWLVLYVSIALIGIVIALLDWLNK